ncbi:MAG: methylenetetrahydrofolate reductase, partial [Clostridiales Family XIII bacterium]|nr:methylenetetrahydrofolate reductase [Clostridiales Family XIII bacterium]
ADIRNILALRGDKCAERPPANHFAYASDLIRHIKEFGDFSVSGACYPENHPETPDRETSLRHLKEKTDAGTEHLISQLFFGNHDFYTFLKDVRAAGIEVPVSAGIMPVTGKGQIERMAALCCAFLPPEVVAMMHRYEFDKDSLMNAGAEYAAAQIKELIARGADGIHLYTMNNPAVVKKIYKEIR